MMTRTVILSLSISITCLVYDARSAYIIEDRPYVADDVILVLGKFGLCLKLISDTEVLSDRFALKFWNHHP